MSAETTVDRQVREAEEQHPDEMAKAQAWLDRQQRVRIGAADRGRRRMSKRYRRKEAARLRRCLECGGGGYLDEDTMCETCEGTGERA